MRAQLGRRRAYDAPESEGDLMASLEQVKRVAVKAVDATNPVQLLYGVVEKANPLEIRIHEKLKLEEEFLDVAEHLTRHERIVSLEYLHPYNLPDTRIGDETKDTISSRNNIGSGQEVPYETFNMQYAKMVFEDGLKIDDKVVLIRKQGGHRFLVVARYKEGEEVWSYQ